MTNEIKEKFNACDLLGCSISSVKKNKKEDEN